MREIPHEFSLILLCARLKLNEPAQKQLRFLISFPLDWGKIKKTSEQQKILPLVYANLNKLGQPGSLVPEEICAGLKQQYLLNLQRNLVLEKEIFRILDLASSRNIRVILFKGLSLIYTLYTDHGLRIMVDADLLIKKEDFPVLKEILLQLGYRADGLLFSKKAFKEQLIYVEVHWKLLPSRPYALKLPMVWERARQINIEGHRFLNLSDEDNFLYLALHLRRHVRNLSLNSIVDIAELLKAKAGSFNWDYVEANARKNHFFYTVYFALYLCRELLGLKIAEGERRFSKGKIRRFFLGWLVNKNNFFSFNSRQGTLVRLLLFDNAADFLIYLCRVSFYERHFAASLKNG